MSDKMSAVAKNALAESIRRGEKLPELLSPAGSYAALMAAREGGADAVYMGGVAFNARMGAKNFTEDEMRRGIALAHSYGVKVYIAANTLAYDRELDGFLRAAEHAYLCGADALIVADLGAAAEIRRRIPIALHASTQLSAHNSDVCGTLLESGFSRVVCAREMSKRNIESFIDSSELEAEVFVHGALCVSHSGQCLFSSLVGGRSGNRGECAQPCRLPYKTGRAGQEYPLSLKDLTLASHIPELCELGIASLKIEGRMKSPEYVRDVTAIWRRLLDARAAASASDIRELEDIFSRSGFTDAYFTERVGKGMLGVRSDKQKQISRTLAPFEKISRKIPVSMQMTVSADAPASLTVTRLDNARTVSVEGEVAQIARTAPMDACAFERSLAKLGDTPYKAQSIDVSVGEGLMMPVSAINALRRAAIAALDATQSTALPPIKHIDDTLKPQRGRTPMRTALFFEPDAIPESAHSYFDIIYVPIEKYNGKVSGVMLPPVIFDSERESVEKMLHDAVAAGAEHALVCNLGHAELARHAGLRLHADFRLNASNNSSVAMLEEQGFEDVILSPELTLSQIRDIGGATFACVYGRIPLMVTEKCVGREIGDCRSCADGRLELVDRMGVAFPVRQAFGHRSIIFNSAPIYMADRRAELPRARITMEHYIFTVESAQEADRVIRAYKDGLPYTGSAKFRRIK